jgi:nicotinamidase-related amidase
MRKPHPEYLNFYYETSNQYDDSLLDPESTALLIIDMQNEFVLRDAGEAIRYKQSGEWERWIPFHDRLDSIVIPNTVKLLRYFREKQLTVTYARIACLRSDGRDRSPVQKTAGWNGIFLPVDSFEGQIIDPLKPVKDEIVVNKTTDSVTSGTNYLSLMHFMNIKNVIVTGIVTDQCVASSIRGLADDGLKVICAEDCCAAGSMELHHAELKIMSGVYCDVMKTEEIIALLERSLHQ